MSPKQIGEYGYETRMKVVPLGVVTSCRKLAGSFRMGQSNPKLLKKGIASSTGPWKHTCLHVAGYSIPDRNRHKHASICPLTIKSDETCQ